MTNSHIIHSTHKTEMCLPSINSGAQIAHLFPNLKTHALISIGLLCDASCQSTLDSTIITFVHKATNNIIMRGQRAVYTKLCLLDVPTNNNQQTDQQPVHQPVQPQVQQSVQQKFQQQQQPLQKANMATNQATATPVKLVDFAHYDIFSPALSTLQK